MSYSIKKYSYQQAKKLNVKIEPSKNKKKKIDVITPEGKRISIGAIGYKDYPTYIQEKGKVFADNRRRLYRIRHDKFKDRKGTPAYYAYRILW